MRQISQTRHVKVTEVARTIIKAHRSVSGPRPPRAQAQPASQRDSLPEAAAPAAD